MLGDLAGVALPAKVVGPSRDDPHDLVCTSRLIHSILASQVGHSTKRRGHCLLSCSSRCSLRMGKRHRLQRTCAGEAGPVPAMDPELLRVEVVELALDAGAGTAGGGGGGGSDFASC
jgi:hypothetical protein